ncbi:hypothetical protein VTJ83DRAFT_6900 [Remersonia thermophila]|uniref:Extracellular serine-rich protein n=1 Tax=Remersonia thermophila TaxID=72144 RepID=A0ABR4D6U8_9PEZI
MQFTTLALAAFASLASAQKTWVVSVAKNGSLSFQPDRLNPQPGEFVQFQFHAGNHTVTQSTFDQPCQPISLHNPNVAGFHSGFLPVAASAEQGMIPTYTIQINSTNPLWLYCAQGQHCQRGMVMVINEPTANASRTLENHKALAANAQTLYPGQSLSDATGSTGGADGSGNSGSTGTPGSSGTPGTGAPGTGATDTPAQIAAAGTLAAPGMFALVAAGAAALLL